MIIFFIYVRMSLKIGEHMKYSKYSMIIIGSGIAGLYAAIKSAQSMNLPDGILIITKSGLNESNSRYAQGGIVGVLSENKGDSVSLHVADTLKSGCGLSDLNVIKYISENSETVIKDLLEIGVNFDHDNDKLKFTLEGAHSIKRILHAGGDATGKYIEQALVKKLKQSKNITVYEQTLGVELLVDSMNTSRGIIALNSITKEYEVIYSAATILASGGCGQIYKYTTNPSVATGDGIALAYKAGAVVQDMEFVQFHPTALSIDSNENRFLISEALRGEGAKLVDSDGRNFITDYTPLAELAPRDVVTRAIFEEMKKNDTNNVYLDATCIAASKLAERFPNISNICLENSIDIAKDYIPVSPAAHYMMGGVKTSIEGITSIKGLYAIGEVACTGLHGANRLASNSLLECVVCAYELSNYLSFANLSTSNLIDSTIMQTIKKYQTYDECHDIDVTTLKNDIQNIMWENVGIVRNQKSLLKAKKAIELLKKEFLYEDVCLDKAEYELRNMLTVAELIVDFAIARKESRGAHYRDDFVDTFEVAKHNYTSLVRKVTVTSMKSEDKIAIT